MGDSREKHQQMWAWWDNEKQKFYHVYESKIQVEICFPDGGKHRTERGEGEIMKVNVEQVNPVDPQKDAVN